jgi:hypothetical protein
MSRIPARSDVEPDPPRLIKGFTMVIQEIENEHTFDSIKLFQQIFGLTPG